MGADGRKMMLPREIIQRFGDFYPSLYNLQSSSQNQTVIDEYIVTSGMPRLTPAERQELERLITLEEIQKAVKVEKRGKTPGPDGFLIQYYRLPFPHIRTLSCKIVQ